MRKKKLKQGSGAYKKPIIIMLEGLDGVGKDTIELAINKSADYRHIVVNRHLGSNYAYAMLYQRKDWRQNCLEYLKLDKIWAKAFKGRVYLAFLHATSDVLRERLKDSLLEEKVMDFLKANNKIKKVTVKKKKPKITG